MAGTLKTSKIELVGDYIGPIWMPNIVCGKNGVSVTLDRNEHKPWTDHYDGDIAYHVHKLANDGDFQYVRFTSLFLVITRTKWKCGTSTKRTRYIDLSMRFDDMMADDKLMERYCDEEDAA